MIPYIHVPDLRIDLGFVTLPLHPFGILVATGVLLATALTIKRGRALGYQVDQLNSFITWMLVAGFIGGHVFDEIFYHWSTFVEAPYKIFFLWEGLSSFGGFLGALIGIILWKYLEWGGYWFRRRTPPRSIFAFADLILSVFPIGWMFGRTGCSVVHDHPGAEATGPLAVAYPPLDYAKQEDIAFCASPDADNARLGPFELVYRLLHTCVEKDGRIRYTLDIHKAGPFELINGSEPRYDMGLLELMFTVVLALVFVISWRRKVKTGTYVVLTALSYAPVRFVMDFFRLREKAGADTRFDVGKLFGMSSPLGPSMTPAQWQCVLLFVFGLVVLVKVLRDKSDPADRVRVY